jgi:4-hydroxy-tetrahydrodipicolinate synthase
MTDIPPIARGVFAAALTPLDVNLDPDHGALARHSRWLLDSGCDGLAVLGTTGEANSFGVNERIGLLDAIIDSGIPPATLLPGTGCSAIPDTVSLTRHAVEAGCAGVVMLPPFYYKGVSDDGLYAAYSEIIQRVGDERLRIYLYHFPKMSQTPLGLDLIERLINAYPDTIVGMKDSSGDLDNMVAAAKNFPGFAVFAGSDSLLLPVLEAGGAGCITACANIACHLARQVMDEFESGADVATHGALDAMRKAIEVFPLSAALKEIMADHTGDAAWRRVRPPLMPLSVNQVADLKARLAGAGATLPPLPVAA